MGTEAGAERDPGPALLALYDQALPSVYGYLLSRCAQVSLAEDLTSQTFLAAVRTIRRGDQVALTTAWLVAVARNKLVDHWRREAAAERGLALLPDEEAAEDPWDGYLDAMRARETLALLGAHHRAALTLRYVDDLPVAQVAEVLDRSVHATEALLVRARAAFRRAYLRDEVDGDA